MKKFITTALALALSLTFCVPAMAHDYAMSFLFGGTSTQYNKYMQNTEDVLNSVSPDYFEVDPHGDLVIPKMDANFIRAMHEKGMSVIPFITNHWDRPSGEAAMVNTEALTTQIAGAIYNNGLDGIVVDIENLPSTARDAQTAFVWRLRDKLPNKIISVAVAANPYKWTTGWHGCYDYAGLAAPCDYLMVMGYDESYYGGPAGPVASAGWVEKSIEYALQNTAPDKIVLGMPFYGRYWKEGDAVGGNGLTSVDIVNLIENYDTKKVYHNDLQSAEVFLTLYDNDVMPKLWGGRVLTPGKYDIWYDDLVSTTYKLELVESYGLLGSGSWALGQDDARIWVQYANYKSAAGEPVQEPAPTVIEPSPTWTEPPTQEPLPTEEPPILTPPEPTDTWQPTPTSTPAATLQPTEQPTTQPTVRPTGTKRPAPSWSPSPTAGQPTAQPSPAEPPIWTEAPDEGVSLSKGSTSFTNGWVTEEYVDENGNTVTKDTVTMQRVQTHPAGGTEKSAAGGQNTAQNTTGAGYGQTGVAGAGAGLNASPQATPAMVDFSLVLRNEKNQNAAANNPGNQNMGAAGSAGQNMAAGNANVGAAQPYAGTNANMGMAQPYAGTNANTGVAQPYAGANANTGVAQPYAGTNAYTGATQPYAGTTANTGMAQPYAGTTADTGVTQPYVGASTNMGAAQPYAGTNTNIGMAQPYAGTTANTGVAQPYAGANANTGATQPNAGTNANTGMAQPYAGTTANTGATQPYAGTNANAGMTQPYAGTNTNTSMAQPYAGTTANTGVTHPYTGANANTGATQPYAGTNANTGMAQPYAGTNANTGATHPYAGTNAASPSQPNAAIAGASDTNVGSAGTANPNLYHSQNNAQNAGYSDNSASNLTGNYNSAGDYGAAGNYNGSPVGNYSNPAGNYGNPAGNYGNLAGSYGNSAGNYGNPAGNYGNSAGNYGNSAGNYSNPAGNYGNPAGNYGNSAGNYGNSAGSAQVSRANQNRSQAVADTIKKGWFSEREYNPNALLTKGDAVKILMRMATLLPDAPDKAGVFSDARNHADRFFIQKAEYYGIAEADRNGAFHPDDPITRQELVMYMDRVFSLPDTVDFENGLAKDISRYDNTEAYYAINKYLEHGIISVDANGNFYPYSHITMREMAEIADKLSGAGIKDLRPILYPGQKQKQKILEPR